jgi:GNAT superfamily N-acetyltransferase
VIREAVPEDVPQIWTLVESLAIFEELAHTLTGTADSLRHWLFEEKIAECLVCEDAGGIVGYAIFFPTFSTFRTRPGIWLEDVFVLPSHRGKGYGKQLLIAVIDIAKQREYGRVEWSVLDWNEGAIGFYEALGAAVLPDWRICRVRLGEEAQP